jgi:hypothetical protein
MNAEDDWLHRNNEYLAAQIAWLHLRLQHLAQPPRPPTPPSTTVIAAPVPVPEPARNRRENFFRTWFFRNAERANLSPLPEAARATDTEDVWIADSQGHVFATAATQGPPQAPEPDDEPSPLGPPAAIQLRDLIGLSAFELHVLLLCAAVELDTRTADLCAKAQGLSRSYPTFALAIALFDDPNWEVLSPERPLRYWRLIEVAPTEGQPLTASPLKADSRIVSYLKGLHYLDERLGPYLTFIAPASDASGDLSPSQLKEVAGIADSLIASTKVSPGHIPVVQLIGPATSGKESIAVEAARLLGTTLYRLSPSTLPAHQPDLDLWVRLWQRESLLRPIGVILRADGSQAASGSDRVIAHILAQLNSLAFLEAREPWTEIGNSLIAEICKPSPAEQASAWAAAAGTDDDAIPRRLAGQFNLELKDIRRIAAYQASRGLVTLDDLWKACLLHIRPHLEALAQRVVPKTDWSDIVLPDPSRQLLEEIAAQVENRGQVYDEWGFRTRMNRGLGIAVLFDGESGTGKTMAAEVLAKHLRLDLYRIDLSAVVSKYIGETEKNLARMFDAAEDGGGILFFDEADAIFGKRSEVKDSHDRYANIEVNYLLQRMESYNGLAILATNMRSALDQAFLRRLRFIVKFPVPGPAERRRIWERIFPPETPIEAELPGELIDFDRLAKVNLTGGNINNAAINAAFLAARKNTKVTMPLVIRAVQTELHKMGRAMQTI